MRMCPEMECRKDIVMGEGNVNHTACLHLNMSHLSGTEKKPENP